MERIEDRSKALSYIGIEIAEALKYIPAPVEEYVPDETIQEVKAKAAEENVVAAESIKVQKTRKLKKAEMKENNVQVIESENSNIEQTQDLKPEVAAIKEEPVLDDAYLEQTRFDVKPSLWQKIKNSKFIRMISYIMKIRVVLEFPTLPEGRGEIF